ncbi:MAG TPA: hypothetical protein PKD99_02250 [Sphingopyxis sp.]|nr:hypothetical protein [Sphingopyxis sp.]HMP43898.1 hypothetical protein [Sphingopyxis sp.]HMQ18065.1 hypothetical protein [Sphingopyxis sp.]
MLDGIVARLKILLGIDSAEFTKGAEEAEAGWAKFQGNIAKGAKLIAGAIAALGIKAMIDDVRRAANESVRLAKDMTSAASAIGVSTDELQRYRYVADQTGVAHSVLEDGLTKVNRKLGEAAEGSKAAGALFARLGIDIRDANGALLDGAAALPMIADALMAIEAPAQRAAVGAALFGDKWPQIAPLLEKGAAGINGLKTEFDALGLSISGDTLAKLGQLGKDLEQLNQQISKEQAEAIAQNAEGILAYERSISSMKIELMSLLVWLDRSITELDRMGFAAGGATREIMESMLTALPRLGVAAWDFGRGVGEAFGRMAVWSIQAVQRLVGGVREWLGERLAAIFDGVKRRVTAVGDWFHDLYVRVVGNSYVPDMVDEIGAHMRRLDAEMVEPVRRTTQTAAEMFRAMQREVSQILARLFPEMAERNRFEQELKLLNDYFDTLIARGGDALAIERARAAAVEALQRAYLGLDRDRLALAPGGEAPGIELADGQKTIEQMNEEVLKRTGVVFGEVGRRAGAMRVQVVDSFARMVDGSLREIDRFVRGIKSGNWLDIIGGLLNAIDGIASILTGGKGTSIGPFVFGGGGQPSGGTPPYYPGSIRGAATGATGVIGGFAGIDRNMLSINGQPQLRVSRGEQLTITPANDIGGGGKMVYFDNRGAVMTEDLLRQMNAMVAGGIAEAAPHIAGAGARQALAISRQRAARTL